MLADLVLPVPCVACGAADGPLCAVCTPHALHTAPFPVAAGARPGGGVPAACVAAGAYRGALRSALIAYKERGARALARPLGVRLATAVEPVAEGRGRLLCVPIPSSAAAIRARGGDHVVRLARFAVATLRQRGFGAEVARLLTMRRVPTDSVGLGAAARRANVAGAFVAAPGRVGALRAPTGSLRGRTTIVLVDDIVTTGATLAEGYRAVAGIGLPVAGAAVVAATPPRGATVYMVRDPK
ncbi:putative amidophosphoribosyltransferase [Cryptosporangium arvum DSM 44712]|uniref:Putative amidophosphoribosyltransferase n=2 Tax=Cryptosporangium TaxID=65502 RepID=A0A010YXR6_9ACTN|nr:putative amidophosphoribosyltransferase [Cryptosporangium arvum DSM 44712]